MFHCIKTGFYAKLPHGYLYGDAFGLAESAFECPPDRECHVNPNITLLLRVCAWSIEPPERIHIELDTWAHWFDETRGEVGEGFKTWRPNSTLIASAGQWAWYGYDGKAAA